LLPNGVGVFRNVNTNAYSFALLDSGSGYPYDLPESRPCVAGETVNLDRVSGGTTYRYVCLRVTGL
jgi:hypothetical protein